MTPTLPGALRKLRSKFDWPLFGAILAIVAIGLLNLYSATRGAPRGLYQNQLLWYAIGGVLFGCGSANADTYYANCAAAWADHAAPLHQGDAGYRSGLDRDGDGVACEKPPS